MVGSRETQVRRVEDPEPDVPAGARFAAYDGTRRATGRMRRLVQSSETVITRIDHAINPPDAPESKPQPNPELGELLADEHFPTRVLGAAALEKASA